MTAYRKVAPYRKPQTYRGLETGGITGFGEQAGYDMPWSRLSHEAAPASLGVHDAAPQSDCAALPSGDLAGHHSDAMQLPVHQLGAHSKAATLPWDAIAARARACRIPLSELAAHNRPRTVRWKDFAGRHGETIALRVRGLTPRAVSTALPWDAFAAQSLRSSLLWQALVQRGAYVALPWGPIGARSESTRIDWPVEPDPGAGTITIPSLPVYVMLPTLSCVRLPDRTPIDIFGISLQADLGSWAWTFSAPMSRASLALLNAPGGAPTQIEVNVNGYVWTFIVDGYDDNTRFGSNTATMRGRSRSALLAEPYAAVRTFTETADRNASQLADQELLSGWTLVWDAPDWLVPGGTFSYQDLAPIDAIAQVANAIGAAVLSDPEALSLTVAPGYPQSPWAWDAATPYAILPASILTAGDSSWVGGTNADGVYVYAENAASGALVKITGSAGATQLPMIVERLAVHADAQRERGRVEIAANGIKRRVGRTIPLFPTPAPVGQPDFGVVPLGKLVEVEDLDEVWRGQVMAVRIDASRSDRGLSVRQQLTIERQYR